MIMEHEESFVYEEAQADTSSTVAEVLADGKPYDVIIRVDNHPVQAHRLVLASRIPYFRWMFESTMIESRQREITMRDIDPLALRDIVSFAYTNKLEITCANVVQLQEASMYLQLDPINNACFEFMSQRIDSDNVLTICACATTANRTDIVKKADRYIRENFDDLSTFEGFTNLSFSKLKELISRNDLNVLSEEIVFQTVMMWVKSSETDRASYLPKLLRHVRLAHLSPEYLNLHVSTERLIMSSSVCKNIINKGKCYIDQLHHFSHSSKLQERYNKETHHLKCAKLKDCGLYFLSGSTKMSRILINYYDPINKKWAKVPNQVRKFSTSFSYYACLEEQVYFLASYNVQSFNLKSLEYGNPIPRHGVNSVGAGVVIHHQKMYFFGGSPVLREVHSFDLENSTYLKVGEMVKKRLSPGVASLGQYIYVTGGFFDGTILSSAERYNPVTEESVEILPMRTRRSSHSCTSLNDKIYVFGGYTGEVAPFSRTSSGEVYDPRADQWTFVKKMSSPRSRVILAPYDNKLYSFGILPDENGRFLFESYDPGENEWKREKSITHILSPRSIEVALTTNSASSSKVPLLSLAKQLYEDPDENV